MNGEQRGHEKTPPKRAGQSAQKQEHENAVGRMQREVDQMRTRRPFAKQFRVQHERQPGQWIAAGKQIGLERPEHVRLRQSTQHVGIAREVIGIVVVDEIEISDPAKARDDDQDQESAGTPRWQATGDGDRAFKLRAMLAHGCGEVCLRSSSIRAWSSSG